MAAICVGATGRTVAVLILGSMADRAGAALQKFMNGAN